MMPNLLVVAWSCAAIGGATAPVWPRFSPARQLQLLDGSDWRFGFAADSSLDPTAVDVGAMMKLLNTTTVVPSAFDAQAGGDPLLGAPGVPGRRGTALYSKTVRIEPGKEGLLHFAACSFYCNVYVDGVAIGDHRASGYVPFELVVPKSAKANRSLLVVANNDFSNETAPTHTGGDFYNYGGITRNVLLHTLPAVSYIGRVETFPTSTTHLDVRVLFGGADLAGAVSLSLAFDGATPTAPKKYPVKDGAVEMPDIAVPDAKPWSTESPNLHTLTVSAPALGDDAVTVRFGLRVLSVKGGRLAVNGDVVKLKGYNRHTMYPDTGSALTRAQVEADVALIVEANANYIRGAHYPQDQRFLDLCDEKGIVVWEETLGPGTTTSHFQDPWWMKHQLIAMHEMVTASINHPAVFFHAFYNEGPSNDEKACPAYNASASVVRQRTPMRAGQPPTRLVTWADCFTDKGLCFQHADVLSFNGYPAWYSSEATDPQCWPTPTPACCALHWENKTEWAKTHWPDKPFTISETGAGGIYEWTNTSAQKWSQGYQAAVVAADAEFAMGHQHVSGLAIWQFSDIKANIEATEKCGHCAYAPHPSNISVPWNCSSSSDVCHRPRGENNKGGVDFWRRKKETWASVAKIYKGAP
jgi:beta-glucuronidase